MLGQKTEATEAMLNGVLGRVSRAPMGRPEEPPASPEPARFEELLEMHLVHSPLLRSKERMIAGAEARVDMARREYYPDFTFTGTVMNRRDMDDMWSLTAAVNIPIFYGSKQRQGVHEAEASLAEARSELDAAKAMHAAQMRDYYSMEQSSRRLMDLYRNGLIPRARQDFESSLAGYTTGKVEAITAISRLKALLDFEILYWRQFAEREKAVARIEAMQEPVAQGSMTQGGNF
jgi:outer membrane protein TolC